MSQSSNAFSSPLETTAALAATNRALSIRGDSFSCNQLHPAHSPTAPYLLFKGDLFIQGEEIKKAAAASDVAGAALFGLIS